MILVLVILETVVSWGNTKSFGASRGGSGSEEGMNMCK